MGLWYAAGVAVIAGVLLHDNRHRLEEFLDPASLRRPVAAQSAARKPEASRQTARVDNPARVVPKPAERTDEQARMEEPAFTGTWYFCASRKDNCIVDSDTIIFHGEKIRIADVDTPQTKRAKCEDERKRGFYAQQRLRELLNEGGFTLASWPGRRQDAQGEKLRVILRNGRSIGEQLVAEGLARPPAGAARSWCS